MKFKYCPNCKYTLTQKEERLVDCSQCGFHFYFNPVPANAVIIENKKDEVLLVRRKIDPHKGRWDLPGGFIDFRESVEDSIQRELKEELGIVITSIEYLTSFPDRYPYKNITYHTLGLVYKIHITDETVSPTDDIDKAQFFTKNTIPYDKLAFESIRYSLDVYFKMKSLSASQ